MKLAFISVTVLLILQVSACSKKLDDCDGGCKGWKPDSGMTDTQKAVYGIHPKS